VLIVIFLLVAVGAGDAVHWGRRLEGSWDRTSVAGDHSKG
jgi:hypothetical protein